MLIVLETTLPKKHYLHCKRLGFGKEKLQLYKLLIFGPPGVGKSSLFQVLLGNNPYDVRNSTGVLNVVQVKFNIAITKPCYNCGTTHNSSTWEIFSRSEEVARLHEVIEKKMKDTSESQVLDDLGYSNSDSEKDTSGDEDVEKYDDSNEEDCTSDEDSHSSDSSCKSDLTDLEKLLLQYTEFTINDFAETILVCYDSGGHLEFFDIMPALTTVPTGNIMVFDMEKGLGRYSVDGFYIEGECYPSQGQSEFDCTKLLQTAVANIQSLAKRKTSPSKTHNLLVVGTHLDKCGDTKAQRNKIVKRLDVHIYEQILGKNTTMVKTRECGKDSEIIHPISNTESSTERDKIAHEIRTAIEDMSKEEIDYSEIQVEWHLFQLEIQETQAYYIGRNDYIKIAKKCNMSKDDAEKALQFYHELGIILHYKEVVDVVFCNPQWLFDCLTDLIIQKYQPYTFGIKENIAKGKFSAKDIEYIYREKVDESGVLEITDLLNIFVHQNIMAPVPNQKEYFMPALLQPSPESIVLSKWCGERVGDTLCAEFDNTYVPRGVFCCLVVNLARNGWVILENITYKDLIVFQISLNEFIGLADRIKYISVEVYLKEAQQLATSHQDVCSLLHHCLKDICAQMKIDWTFKFGFAGLCATCSEIACVDLQFPYTLQSKCKTCGKINYVRNYDQLVWLLPPHVTEMLKQQQQVLCYMYRVYTVLSKIDEFHNKEF